MVSVAHPHCRPALDECPTTLDKPALPPPRATFAISLLYSVRYHLQKMCENVSVWGDPPTRVNFSPHKPALNLRTHYLC